MLKTFHASYIGKKKSRAVTALSLLFLMLCLTGCSMEGKNMQLSIHSTSADVKAKHLEQEQILVATMSGDIEIGEFVAEEGDLSSGSGDITLDNMQVQEAAITTASGDVELSLPEKGAKIKYTTTGGELETDLYHKKTGNIYVFPCCS